MIVNSFFKTVFTEISAEISAETHLKKTPQLGVCQKCQRVKLQISSNEFGLFKS